MLSKCCYTGFEWDGKPTGHETILASKPTYVVGDNPDFAVFYVADAMGWRFVNNRLLADHIAREANVTVYMPDFFDDELIPLNFLQDPKNSTFDIQGWTARNGREAREPDVLACGRELRGRYKRIMGAGACYGGWANLRLGARADKASEGPLVDAISIAHPTFVTKEDLANVGVPTQILAPEVDPVFPDELKEYANKVIPTLGVAYEYVFFPGVKHGFATKGDDKDGHEGRSMIRAKNATVAWAVQWLHGVTA